MKPTVYFATDHAGFALKEVLVPYVRDVLGYTVVDCGADHYDAEDDYPDYITKAVVAVAKTPSDRAIILGGSGQGEAMVANRFALVRAVVFYGEPTLPQTDAAGDKLGIVASSRIHNNANVLALGARFLTSEVAKTAVALWLTTPFSNDERHIRRIKKIEQLDH